MTDTNINNNSEERYITSLLIHSVVLLRVKAFLFHVFVTQY